MTPLRRCSIRVPGSTSNLGAGFDCIGLAFNRYIDATFTPADGRLVYQRHGTLRDVDVIDAHDRFLVAFRNGLERRGAAGTGGTLVATSSIPIARGLGSSGAATVAGIALAAAACGDTLDRDAALADAMAVEGHPDNAAPALFGGLVAIARDVNGTPRTLRLPLSEAIGWAFAAPATAVSTADARDALPTHVPHDVAARGLGRMAALLHGLADADAASIRIGFADELHVPYRLSLIPGVDAAMAAALDAGAWAATISGSGSGLIAACPPESAERVARAMTAAFGGERSGAIGFVAAVDTRGARALDANTEDAMLQGAQ